MITRGCNSFGELCSLVAAGAATPEEKRILKAHLIAGCDACAPYLSDMRETAAMMAHSLPPIAPPPSVRSRLLHAIAEEAAVSPILINAPVQPKTEAAPAAFRFSWFGGLGWAFAGLLAIVLLGNNSKEKVAQLESQIAEFHLTVAEQERAMAFMTARQTQFVAMQGLEVSPDARAKAFWNPETNAGLLMTFGLPPLPEGKVYQLWAIQEAAPPIDAGTFSLDAKGVGTLQIKAIPDLHQPVALFAITIEPAGGSSGPTGAMYLKGVPQSS
jgi:hypothetical protein